MLHAVLEYARSRDLAPEPGFKQKTVRWLLRFTPDGAFIGVDDNSGDKSTKVKGREFKKCPDLPGGVLNAGKGVRYFLADNLDVVLNWCDAAGDDLAAKQAKLAIKHAYFVQLLTEAQVIEPVFAHIAASLSDPDVTAAIIRELSALKAKPTEIATLGIQSAETGLRTPLAEDIWHDWWRAKWQVIAGKSQGPSPAAAEPETASEPTAAAKPKKRAKAAATAPLLMRCLLSGELTTPQPTHGKISGLVAVGGGKAGDVVASFDKDAFQSFALEQGANAAMSPEMATTYVAALNELIRTHSVSLVGTKVLYWFSRELSHDLDVLRELQGFLSPDDDDDDDDDAARNEPAERPDPDINGWETTARKLLESIRTGDRKKLKHVRFYAITLSANSGRVMIRDFMEGAFEDLAAAIAQWFGDLSIISRDGDRVIPSHKFGAVLAAPVRDRKDIPSPLVLALWQSALKGTAIPLTVVAQTLRRVTLDVISAVPANHARIGLLKAFLNRLHRNSSMSAESDRMTTKLNLSETDPAYLCGRIMALLGQLQYAALGDVGAGVVQRYYAAASVTPGLVLGRLVRLAQTAHLPKLNSMDKQGLRGWYEKQLTEVWAAMHAAPPAMLSLEQQTLFAMGYYHQQAHRYQKTAPADTQPE